MNSIEMLPMRASFEDAIRAVLNTRRLTKLEIQSYFADADHVRVGVVLDEMVKDGAITSIGGARPTYSLAVGR